ncbi:MAG TPA: HAD-IIIA family hydrolase [Anaerolineae bacterium]|nr:HAD-IIIA family hydrolase [Anaerolineae bacterium]
MLFVGLDLAWSPRNPSGLAVLDEGGQIVEVSGGLGSDDEIVDTLARLLPGEHPGLIAIDAPLAVPNETGARPCDREVAAVFGRFEAGPHPANRHALGRYGGLRGEEIRRHLESLGFHHSSVVGRGVPTRQVIEVFPHPAMVVLFGLGRTLKYKPRKGRDTETRRAELGRLIDHLVALQVADPPLHLTDDVLALDVATRKGRRLKEAEDVLDAIVCAYSALHAWRHGPRGYAVYGQGAVQPDQEAGHILVPMTAAAWDRIKTDRLLFVDRDGTLNRSLGDRPPNRPGEVEILPAVGRALHHAASLGWRLVLVTNQGGVAFGYQTHRQAWRTLEAVLDALPVRFDAVYLCPHHPHGSDPRYAVACPNRKPEPGFLLDALARYDARPEECLFVGDMDTDRLAAEAAGVPFRWAWDYFADAFPRPAPE